MKCLATLNPNLPVGHNIEHLHPLSSIERALSELSLYIRENHVVYLAITDDRCNVICVTQDQKYAKRIFKLNQL